MSTYTSSHDHPFAAVPAAWACFDCEGYVHESERQPELAPGDTADATIYLAGPHAVSALMSVAKTPRLRSRSAAISHGR